MVDEPGGNELAAAGRSVNRHGNKRIGVRLDAFGRDEVLHCFGGALGAGFLFVAQFRQRQCPGVRDCPPENLYINSRALLFDNFNCGLDDVTYEMLSELSAGRELPGMWLKRYRCGRGNHYEFTHSPGAHGKHFRRLQIGRAHV